MAKPLLISLFIGREGLVQALPGGGEIFGQDASFADDGHEIGVAGPAGEHVLVKVVGYSGAGGFTEVDAGVEAVGGVDLAKDAVGSLGEGHEFGGFVWLEAGEVGLVAARDDHDVAGVVGEGVEADIGVRRAENYASGTVGFVGGHAVGDGIVGGGEEVAEDAVFVAGPGFESRWDAGASGGVDS